MDRNQAALYYLQMMNPNDYFTLRVTNPEFKQFTYNTNNQELANALYDYANKYAPIRQFNPTPEQYPMFGQMVNQRDAAIREALERY